MTAAQDKHETVVRKMINKNTIITIGKGLWTTI